MRRARLAVVAERWPLELVLQQVPRRPELARLREPGPEPPEPLAALAVELVLPGRLVQPVPLVQLVQLLWEGWVRLGWQREVHQA